MPQVNREEFLSQLEAVQSGLSNKDMVEQSSCFLFFQDRVATFNDEIACSLATSPGIEGAVRAGPLLELLKEMEEDEIEVHVSDDATKLVVKGVKKTARIAMEKEIVSPLDQVEPPEGWRPLAENFSDAVHLVQSVAGKDAMQPMLTCVHITPKWVEAANNTQLARYKLETGFDEPVLVKQKAIKFINGLGVNQFSETESWIHFKNPAGLVFSCRRYVEQYPNVAEVLKFNGERVKLPKDLGKVLKRAGIFSKENADANVVTVNLVPGKIRVISECGSGDYREFRNIAYDGSPMTFMVSPEVLAAISEKHNECIIGDDKLKVKSGSWTYVSCLNTKED